MTPCRFRKWWRWNDPELRANWRLQLTSVRGKLNVIKDHLHVQAIHVNCSYLKRDIHHFGRIQVTSKRSYEERYPISKTWLYATKYYIENRHGSYATVQVLQKARTKKIITKTVSSDLENPKKKEWFCTGNRLPHAGSSVSDQRTLKNC